MPLDRSDVDAQASLATATHTRWKMMRNIFNKAFSKCKIREVSYSLQISIIKRESFF